MSCVRPSHKSALASFCLLGAVLVPAPLPGSLLGELSGKVPEAIVLPRSKTLYASGTSYSPPVNFNPLDKDSYTGTQGLLYEPLFLYDPVRSRMVPWLATAGEWVSPSTYRIDVRKGVDWVSSPTGKVVGTMTAADVAYSVNLAASSVADPYHDDAASVLDATAAGSTVTVRFRSPVAYAQWQEFLWHSPVVPAAQLSAETTAARFTGDNTAPESTGPMLLDSKDRTEACYRDNPHWWGTPQLKLAFRFEYLCDMVSGSSGASLSALLDGRVDWSNQLLRGVPELADSKAGGYGIKTYFPARPYMLAASTALLEMNLSRAPLSNLDFRKAVAYALDPSAIATDVYTGTVEAAGPTGVLPELGPYVDQAVVRKYGFGYAPSTARRYLKRSGYRGQPLVLVVPRGMPDIAGAASMICHELGSVGIRASTEELAFGDLNRAVADGAYQMVISTPAGLGSTPWDYFERVYQLPLHAVQADGVNIERFTDTATWSLVERADAIPTSDGPALRAAYAAIEEAFLRQLPVVPLWFSGAWFQASTAHWRDYPSALLPGDRYTPEMGRGWLGATTTVLALAALRPS